MERQDLIFRVFVSSTFSDMIVERSALQEHVFPELRKYCQEHGARFQAIDLRWGVGQEAALDQQTMNICVRELCRCQQLSPRPNFIVLLGDRYGWRPLPPQIEAEEFDALKARLTDGEQKRLLQWYRQDGNAEPPEYCLLPRTGEFADATRWSKEESELRAILLKAVEQVLPADVAARRKYYDSATHLIAVASRPEHLERDWPRYEWETFHAAILSGRKRRRLSSGGKPQLLSFIKGFQPVDLPTPLWRYQAVEVTRRGGLKPALAELLRFVH